MEINEAFVLQSIGLPALTDIARQAAGVKDLELQDWRVNQIAGGLGNPVSVGLYRVAGHGRAAAGRLPWSMILKVIQSPANAGWSGMGEADDPAHWNYWKRELFVYRSGLLDTLPAGLVAPHFYGASELPGDVACLWLEDVADDYQDAWPFARYALAARHLGRLNGVYANGVYASGVYASDGIDSGGRSPTVYPWLARQRLRQWCDQLPEWGVIPWDHPRVRAHYPAAEVGNLRRMLSESADFVTRLERLPHTLCHGDTYPTNFKSRGAAGGEETVALDWALAHHGPVGYDLGQLVLGAYLNLPDFSLPDVDRALFAAYMAGLQDAGYEANSVRVRFAYATTAALANALFKLMMLSNEIEQGETAAADAAAPANPRPCFEAAMADIAWELRNRVGSD